MLLIICLLALCLLVFPVQVGAQNVYEYLKPSTVQVEYAGNYGFMSLGLGQTFYKEQLSSYLLVGYLPEQINGAEVTSVALKNTFRMKQFDVASNKLNLYAGVSVIYYHAHNTYSGFPKYFPKGYYDFPTALHAAPVIGASYRMSRKNEERRGGWAIFSEFSTLDYHLINFFRNRSMNFFELWNMGVGVSWYFR